MSEVRKEVLCSTSPLATLLLHRGPPWKGRVLVLASLCIPVQHPCSYPPTFPPSLGRWCSVILHPGRNSRGLARFPSRANFQQPASPVNTSSEGRTLRGMAGVQKRPEERQQHVCVRMHKALGATQTKGSGLQNNRRGTF